MRLRTLLQRQHHINHRLQQSPLQKFHRRQKIRLRPHKRPQQRNLPRKQIPNINRSIKSSSRPASHQPPARHQTPNTLVPSCLTHMLKHHIHSPPPSQLPHFRSNLLRRMINHLIRAELTSLGQLSVRPRSSNHPRPRSLRNLNRRRPHTTPRRQHQNCLRRLQPRPRKQHMPSRQRHQRKRRRFLKTHSLRNRHAIPRRRRNKLRAPSINRLPKNPIRRAQIIVARRALRANPARNPRLQHHPIPNLHIRNARPHPRHFPRNIAPRNMWQWNLQRRNPSPQPKIQMIQRASPHPHQNFAHAGNRLRDLNVLQNLRPAMLRINNRLHEFTLRSLANTITANHVFTLEHSRSPHPRYSPSTQFSLACYETLV
jgi:hypothetical protein